MRKIIQSKKAKFNNSKAPCLSYPYGKWASMSKEYWREFEHAQLVARARKEARLEWALYWLALTFAVLLLGITVCLDWLK